MARLTEHPSVRYTDPARDALVLAAAIVLAYLRFAGHKGEVFQAVAHLFVGALTGAAMFGHHHREGRWGFYAGLALALGAAEVAAFLVGQFS